MHISGQLTGSKMISSFGVGGVSKASPLASAKQRISTIIICCWLDHTSNNKHRSYLSIHKAPSWIGATLILIGLKSINISNIQFRKTIPCTGPLHKTPINTPHNMATFLMPSTTNQMFPFRPYWINYSLIHLYVYYIFVLQQLIFRQWLEKGCI